MCDLLRQGLGADITREKFSELSLELSQICGQNLISRIPPRWSTYPEWQEDTADSILIAEQRHQALNLIAARGLAFKDSEMADLARIGVRVLSVGSEGRYDTWLGGNRCEHERSLVLRAAAAKLRPHAARSSWSYADLCKHGIPVVPGIGACVAKGETRALTVFYRTEGDAQFDRMLENLLCKAALIPHHR